MTALNDDKKEKKKKKKTKKSFQILNLSTRQLKRSIDLHKHKEYVFWFIQSPPSL